VMTTEPMLLSNSEPALLTRSEISWLLNSGGASGKKNRDVKYRIRRKLSIFFEVELPLLQQAGFLPEGPAAAISRGVCAQNQVSHTGGREFESLPIHLFCLVSCKELSTLVEIAFGATVAFRIRSCSLSHAVSCISGRALFD
jgi:hypothetical protein